MDKFHDFLSEELPPSRLRRATSLLVGGFVDSLNGVRFSGRRSAAMEGQKRDAFKASLHSRFRL